MEQRALKSLGTSFATRHARNKAVRERIEATSSATFVAISVTAAALVFALLLISL